VRYTRTNLYLGIGKASAFAVAKHGIERLSITDVSQKSLAETTKALQDQFPKLEILSRQLNVCDEAVRLSSFKSPETLKSLRSKQKTKKTMEFRNDFKLGS
jgi:hypothetical protein